MDRYSPPDIIDPYFFDSYRNALNAALSCIDREKVARALEWLRQAREAGNQIFICGNGGSMANASHFACDLGKGAGYGRTRRFKVISLNDNIPTLTAYANDVGYESVFVEQLKNLARSGDVLMALSGSGNSANVLRAIEWANANGVRTIGLTGRDGGKLAPLAQINIHVDAAHMGRIEDAHMAVCHAIAYYFMEKE